MKLTIGRAALVAGFVVSIMWLGRAAADDAETRDMAIHVDGKPAGESHITVAPQNDGSAVVSVAADVAVDAFLMRYKYSYRGTELWKDGKLQKFDSNTNDNGKKMSVMLVAENDGLRMKAGGKEHMVRADTWTSSYIRYPDVSRCDKQVPLVEIDSGKELAPTLQYVGKEERVVAGNKTSCEHFRLSGGITVDLWYDGQKRLVRQESLESGHRLLIEMVGLHR